MKLAVVGSREGADLENVRAFVLALPRGTTLVSGGAEGVDQTGERAMLERGGMVVSLRAVRFPDGSYGVERWELGGDRHRLSKLTDHPTFEDFTSALLYRDILIAEECDRLAAFMRQGGSPGASKTAAWAEEALGRPTFRFFREAA